LTAGQRRIAEKVLSELSEMIGVEGVTLNFKKMSPEKFGSVTLTEGLTVTQVDVSYDNLGSDVGISRIAHELEHARQINQGDLKLEAGNVLWKNEIHSTVLEVRKASRSVGHAYLELPWEVQARETQAKIPKGYFESVLFETMDPNTRKKLIDIGYIEDSPVIQLPKNSQQ